MTDNEHPDVAMAIRLRQAASVHRPQPDWADMVSRLQRTSRRRRVPRSGVFAGAVAAVAVSALAVGSGLVLSEPTQQIEVGPAVVQEIERLLPAPETEGGFTPASYEELTFGELFSAITPLAGYGQPERPASGIVMWADPGEVLADVFAAESTNPLPIPPELSSLSGVLVFESAISWEVGAERYTVTWSDGFTVDQAVAIVLAAAPDPRAEIRPDDLPQGLVRHFDHLSVPFDAPVHVVTFEQDTGGGDLSLTSIEAEVPPMVIDLGTQLPGWSGERHTVERRGASVSIVLNTDPDSFDDTYATWHEAGMTHLLSLGPFEDDPPNLETLLSILDRLQSVDDESWLATVEPLPTFAELVLGEWVFGEQDEPTTVSEPEPAGAGNQGIVTAPTPDDPPPDPAQN